MLRRVCLSHGSGSGWLSTRATSLIRRSQSRRHSSRSGDEAAQAATVRQQLESAAREDGLDFLTAARILFSTPAKPRKFGLDFHLWQFFVACLPPFAVYLTAQYARYEMRRMEKEREVELLEKQQEELSTSQTADEAAEVSGIDSGTSSSKLGAQHHPVSEPGTTQEPIVSISEKEFRAMKARLDAMEEKVWNLESRRPRPVSNISSVSATDVSKVSEEKQESVRVGTNVGKPSRPEPSTGRGPEENAPRDDKRAPGAQENAIVEGNEGHRKGKIDSSLDSKDIEEESAPQWRRPHWFRLWKHNSVDEVSE